MRNLSYRACSLWRSRVWCVALLHLFRHHDVVSWVLSLFSLGSATSCFRHQQREGIGDQGWLRFPFNLDGVAEFEQETSLTLWFRCQQHHPVPDA